MANGDVDHADVEGMIQGFDGTSQGGPSDTQVDAFCAFINNDVDLALQAAGFALNLTHASNISWAQMTKLFGASAMALDAIYALSGAESERAQSWWDIFERRLQQLIDNPGMLDDSDLDSSADPQFAPTLVGYSGTDGRKRHLLYRERAAVQQGDDEEGANYISDSVFSRTRRV